MNFVSIICMVLFLISSCGVKSEEGYTKLDNVGIISDISYEIHDNYNQGGYDYSQRGYYVDTVNTPGSPYFYIITMGEKNTGGYAISIVDLKIDEGNNVEVLVKESSPEPGANVTMAFTYPACCLELSVYPNDIIIKNTNGAVFKQLN